MLFWFIQTTQTADQTSSAEGGEKELLSLISVGHNYAVASFFTS